MFSKTDHLAHALMFVRRLFETSNFFSCPWPRVNINLTISVLLKDNNLAFVWFFSKLSDSYTGRVKLIHRIYKGPTTSELALQLCLTWKRSMVSCHNYRELLAKSSHKVESLQIPHLLTPEVRGVQGGRLTPLAHSKLHTCSMLF